MHDSHNKTFRKELVLLDKSNPRSLVSLLPEAMEPLLSALWNSENGKLLSYSEKRLRDHLHVHACWPEPVDERIRLNFWLEYERIQAIEHSKGHKIDMAYVIGHAMAKEVFYKHYITNPLKLVWMLCPPHDLEVSMKLAFTHCMDRIVDVVRKLGEKDEPTKNDLDFLLKTQERLSAQLYGTKVKGEKVTKGEESEPEPPQGLDVPAAPSVSAEDELKRELEALSKIKPPLVEEKPPKVEEVFE